jgi:glycosyltransferase involved in cell wall biosynthesis
MKMTRYLPEHGWQPYVVCATPVWGSPVEPGLLEQVAHAERRCLPDRDVAGTVARLTAPLKRVLRRSPARAHAPEGAGAPVHGTQPSAPLSTRIARSLFIDSAEPWSRSVPAAAVAWAQTVPFDVVLATGPPHSTLVAGARVAAELGLPYVAELRDAWGGNPGYQWPPAHRQGARSVRLEREAMSAASAVIAISGPIAEEARAAGAREAVVIPNGFDPSDVPRWAPAPGPVRVAFMGRFYDATDPTPFFDGVALAVQRGGPARDLHLDLVGPDSATAHRLVAERGLESRITYHGFRPHDEALEIVSQADVGLVVLADRPGSEAIYTSKIFEYLGMGIPILLVGTPEGVAAGLLREAAAGVAVPYDRPDLVAAELERLAAEKAGDGHIHAPRADVVARFTRQAQSGMVAEVLSRVVNGDV